MRFADISLLATEMHDKMCTPSDHLAPIPVLGNSHSLESVIKDYYPKKNIIVDIYHTTPTDDKTYGLYTRYENDIRTLFDIDISSMLNPCWTRFVGAKELSHALLDRSQSSKTTDILPLINMLLSQSQEINIDDDIHSEYAAFCFAVELLVPYRVSLLVTDPQKTSYEIAQQLSVPEKIVDLTRTAWYQELREKSYRDL